MGRTRARGTGSMGLAIGRLTGVLCLLLGALSLWSAPALALSQRGHVFSFAFGSKGTGDDQFTEPDAIAIDNATGNVYVADRKQGRVQELEPETTGGSLVGEKYLAAFEVPSPDAIAVDNCAGASGRCSEAEDPSVGDVYVSGKKGKVVYKFTPAGEKLGEITEFQTKHQKLNAVKGVAVDAAGDLFVYQADGQIFKFNDAKVNEGQSEVQLQPGFERAGFKGTETLLPEESLEPAFAVNAEGDDFYAGMNPEGAEETPQHELFEQAVKEFTLAREASEDGQAFTVAAKLDGAGAVLIPALDYELTSAVAVNPADVPSNDVDERNDVYAVNVNGFGAAERASTVAEFGLEEAEGGEHEKGEVIQRFGAPGLKEAKAIAVDAQTGAVYVVDAASHDVDVFALERPGPPTVEGSEAKSAATPATETVSAQVNPEGLATDYYVEYGVSGCSLAGSCARTAAEPVVGEGFGAVSVSRELHELPAGSVFYRVVADNASGQAEQVYGAVASLGGAPDGLPDGRAWEMVSPPNKDGAEAEPLTAEGGLIQAAENGLAISFVANGPMPVEEAPEGSRSPEPTQILSTRGAGGWKSQDIDTPNKTGSGLEVGLAPEYQFFSRNLALALLNPGGTVPGALASPPLSPALKGEGEQERTIYLRDDAPLAPEASEEASYEKAKKNGEEMKPQNAGFLALLTHANVPGGGAFGGDEVEGLQFSGTKGTSARADATADLGHVVFTSQRPAGSGVLPTGLYEWSAGSETVTPVSELKGTEVGDATLGAGEKEYFATHAISENGSLVYWTDNEPVSRHLYVTDTETGEVLQVDASQGGTEEGARNPIFDTASAEGNRVFFTDEQRLTPGSRAGAGAPNLYVFELHLGAGALSGTLTDLTPQAGANVLANETGGGGVLGASEDGSYVYFMANGALAPGASHGYCPASNTQVSPPGTTCNLYVNHYDGAWSPEATKFIAALSSEDKPDWGGEQLGQLGFTTSRVSPNGLHLAFMSDRSLTGYDNIDENEATGRHADEEVYEYSAETETEPEGLACASCNPTGERPAGVHDVGSGGESANAEGKGLVVDRIRIWAEDRAAVDHWLAGSVPGYTNLNLEDAVYQSRYLSEDGRLFFDSPDHLVPAATGDKEKVYEYEPNNVGSCHSEAGCIGLISAGSAPPGTAEHESAFIDASADGNDVFFVTAAQLTPQDTDSNYDVYDAHVCEAASPCVFPSQSHTKSCEGEHCQKIYVQLPGFAEPSTGTSSGNVTGQVHVLGTTTTSPPPPPHPSALTNAQRLAKALHSCKTRYKRQKRKRLACEKQARKKYGTVKHAALATSHGKVTR